MKTKELWRLRSEITGRLYSSRYVMTEADAMELDPLAERVAFSKEARLVPENDIEMDQLRDAQSLS